MGLQVAFCALTGRGLEQFQPEKQLESTGRSSVVGVDLQPWDSRGCFKSCHDEEAVGFRMVNFLAGPCGLRCYAEPESSHPCWNDFLNAINDAGLKPMLLKGTLLCNWTRGPFGSGVHQTRLSDAALDLMNRKGDDPEFMSQFSELTAADRCVLQCDLTPDEWVQVCEKRIAKARGKAWFGIAESFAQLERNWSILSETVSHIQTLQKLLAESLGKLIQLFPFFVLSFDYL